MNNIEFSSEHCENLALVFDDLNNRNIIDTEALSQASADVVDEFVARYYLKCSMGKHVDSDKIRALFDRGDLLVHLDFSQLVEDARLLLSIYNEQNTQPLKGIVLYGSALSLGRNFRLKDISFPSYLGFSQSYASDFDMLAISDEALTLPENAKRMHLKQGFHQILRKKSIGFNILGRGHVDISSIYTLDDFIEHLRLASNEDASEEQKFILRNSALAWGWNPDRIYYLSATSLEEESIINENIQSALRSDGFNNHKRDLLEYILGV